jgi:hypothetical protein
MPMLRKELVARKISTDFSAPNDKIFATGKSGTWSRDDARKRIVDKAVELADKRLERSR